MGVLQIVLTVLLVVATIAVSFISFQFGNQVPPNEPKPEPLPKVTSYPTPCPGGDCDGEGYMMYPELKFERDGDVIDIVYFDAIETGCRLKGSEVTVDLSSKTIMGTLRASNTLLEKSLDKILDSEKIVGAIVYYHQIYFVTNVDGVLMLENYLADDLNEMTYDEFCELVMKNQEIKPRPTGGYGLG